MGVLSDMMPKNPMLSALATIGINTFFSGACVFFGTVVLGGYGFIVFVGLPLALGLTTILLHGAGGRRGFLEFFVIGWLSSLALFATLMILPMEGAGCLLMAAPLWLACNTAAVSVGYAIHWALWGTGAARGFPMFALIIAALVPALMGVEKLGDGEPAVVAVTTVVEIDAPPEVVWKNVIAFPPLRTPDDWVFRLGAAYPVQAVIVGRGVGAVRHCIFSTGSFVEPITTWEENRLLEFEVVKSPPSMREWSLYENLHPPHVEGYFVSRRGQFLLTPLAGNRTRLAGTTWYQNHMAPAWYWQLWTDGIIHHIHGEVLTHIKDLSEAERGEGAAARE